MWEIFLLLVQSLGHQIGVTLLAALLGNLDLDLSGQAHLYSLAGQIGSLPNLYGLAQHLSQNSGDIGSGLGLSGQDLGGDNVSQLDIGQALLLVSLGHLALTLLSGGIQLGDLLGGVVTDLFGQGLICGDGGVEFTISHLVPLSLTLGSEQPNVFYLEGESYISLTFYIYYSRILSDFQIFCS